MIHRITPPRTAEPYPDRDLDCQMAAEDAFQELIEAIVAAGWAPDEVAQAVAALADNHIKAREANAETNAAIAGSRRRQ